MSEPVDRRINPGERLDGLPSAAWNSFVEAARHSERRRSTPSAPDAPSYMSKDVVRLYNNTGVGLLRYAVVAVNSPLITSSTNLASFKEPPVVLEGTKPAGDHDRLAIVLEPAAVGKVVSAAVCGVIPVYLTGDATDGSYASSEALVTESMKTSANGHRILWRDSSTGPCWGLVALHDRGTPIGLVNASGMTPTSGQLITTTVTTLEGEALSGQQIYVYGVVPLRQLPDPTYLFAWWQDDKWVAIYRRVPMGLANVSGLTPVSGMVTATVVTWQDVTLEGQSVKIYGAADDEFPSGTHLFVWEQDGQWSAVYHPPEEVLDTQVSLGLELEVHNSGGVYSVRARIKRVNVERNLDGEIVLAAGDYDDWVSIGACDV